ncbi:DNA polymerase subunit gamma-2, mitochondrial [Leptinotarsa decemlineata]|uniref:DNA polymerase subunit gamma-2, mitochondrial n=1 Tax=Leptinotarsa decemlineata TaxID=7539 RepID=UPI003D309D5A
MLHKILNLATSNGFVKRTVLAHLNMSQYEIGPIGEILRHNLMTEWYYNIVFNKDVTVIMNNGDFTGTYEYLKAFCSDRLPFGIADIKKLKKSYSTDEIIEHYKKGRDNRNTSFKDLMRHEEDSLCNCTIFVPPSNSTRFFHQWQQQRRMWWRKFSAGPGRYSLTDIKKGDNNSQRVEIIVKYPWGSESLETITLGSHDRKLTNAQLEFQENKKTIHAHAIVSQINLTSMFMNSICDAFDETLVVNKARKLLRLHKKLAPFKISLAVSGADQSSTAELSDLAVYICRQLRTNHVSTLLLPSSNQLKLDAQFKQYDELGVPYTILLSDSTLKDGIVFLRNRETTLKEQVHVSQLVTYIDQLLKNY